MLFIYLFFIFYYIFIFYIFFILYLGSCSKIGQYKENKKNNTRMLDTIFIEDFIDSMEEYFHF